MVAFLSWGQSRARSPASCAVCQEINVLSELAALAASTSGAANNALGHSQHCLEALLLPPGAIPREGSQAGIKACLMGMLLPPGG